MLIKVTYIDAMEFIQGRMYITLRAASVIYVDSFIYVIMLLCVLRMLLWFIYVLHVLEMTYVRN